MRRTMSLMLSLALLFSFVPTAAFGTTVGTASVVTVATATELVAALADSEVNTITVSADITTTAKVVVNRPVVIDGAGHTLTVVADLGTNNSSKHALGLYSGTAANPVVVTDLVVDSDSKAYGINTYGNAVVVLDGVTSKNSKGAGLIVNGSTVTATDFTTSGNAWGAVNVDPGVGVVAPSVFNFVSGSLGEANKIWSDGANVTESATVVVNAADAGFVQIPTVSGPSLWTVPRTVVVTDAAGLIAAVHDLKPCDTIEMAAGTYDVERALGDMSFGGQTGWYMPLWQPGVTLKGAGSAVTTLTSSVQSANGVWASQDFISVWANNVTVQGLTIVPKVDTNKAIEVMGKNFTAKDLRLISNVTGPWIDEPFERFGGSLYFNPVASVTGSAGNVGAARLENVYVDGAWVSAPVAAVSTGTVTLSGVVIDWENAAYGPYAAYGVISNNPVFVVDGGLRVVAGPSVADVQAQILSRVPAGTTVEILGAPASVPASLFDALKRNGEFPVGGSLSFSSPDTSTEGVVPYTWSFQVSTLDTDYAGTFAPEVSVRTTLDTPLRFGLTGIELIFEHTGDLPGPASLKLFVSTELAGKQFDLHAYGPDGKLGESVERVTVDEDGYITVSITSADEWRLYEFRELAVRFDAKGGSAVAAQAVPYGSFAATPAVPARLGYRFLGWYADSALTDAWSFTGDRVMADTVLYAKWAALPKASVGNVVAPASMARTKASLLFGYLKPQHKQGSYPVRIYKQRNVGGKWVSYGYVDAKVSNRYGYSKYVASVTLPSAGKWRVRAYAPADADHAASWSSAFRYVTVK